ncbi:MAG: hypothetical protein ACRET0_02070, partial [Steroidobacteraceae bacterium]
GTLMRALRKALRRRSRQALAGETHEDMGSSSRSVAGAGEINGFAIGAPAQAHSLVIGSRERGGVFRCAV